MFINIVIKLKTSKIDISEFKFLDVSILFD